MFFFFIGGVQPKVVTLDETTRLCVACGLSQAKLKRIDHYLSLFFIPILRVKKGEPVLICERCGFTISPSEAERGPTIERIPRRCQHCGFLLDPSFNYCPNCGRKL